MVLRMSSRSVMTPPVRPQGDLVATQSLSENEVARNDSATPDRVPAPELGRECPPRVTGKIGARAQSTPCRSKPSQANLTQTGSQGTLKSVFRTSVWFRLQSCKRIRR